MYQEKKIMLWLYIHIIFRVQLKCVAMSQQIIPRLHYNKTQASFIQQAKFYYPAIKFTAEISQTEITFLDTTVYKRKRFAKQSYLKQSTMFIH